MCLECSEKKPAGKAEVKSETKPMDPLLQQATTKKRKKGNDEGADWTPPNDDEPEESGDSESDDSQSGKEEFVETFIYPGFSCVLPPGWSPMR